MNNWQCCGKNYAPGVKTCRKCGKSKPVYGIVETAKKPTASKKPRNPCDLSRCRDPLISKDENRLFVSTLKMKDGRTAEDIKKEREG